MALLFKDRVLETSTTTGTGTYTLAGAVTGYQAFSAVGDANTCMYSAWEVDGNGNPSGGWEVGYGTYTLSGTTLARTAIIASTNSNNAVSWAAGTRRIACVLPALQGNVAPQSLAGGRLTLATGYSVYAPQPATPSSTDTGTDIVTFAAAHGWVTGTLCTPASTLNGLTAGTTYYLRADSTTTASFYDTLAHAEAGGATGIANLSGNITQQIIPFGVQSTTIKYVPHVHDMIGLLSADGLTWGQYTIGSGLSLALGTLTSGGLYDVFCYVSSGVVTLKLGPAWASATSRGTGAGTTEIVMLNGRWVNAVSISSGPGAQAGVLLGTIRMISTTAAEDSCGGAVSQVGGKRFVVNVDNQVPLPLTVRDAADSWIYSADAYRQADGAVGNQVETLACLPLQMIKLTCHTFATNSAANQGTRAGIGLDSTTVVLQYGGVVHALTGSGPVTGYVNGLMIYENFSPLGYHYWVWLERGPVTGTCTWYGDAGITDQAGMTGTFMG